MPNVGPNFIGVAGGYGLLDGQSYSLFAPVEITDTLSQTLSLSITVSDPSQLALTDPNASTDGSSYNAATGVYEISGTTASVSAAVAGLILTVASAAPPSLSDATLSFSATDGLGLVGGPSVALQLIAPTAYVGEGYFLVVPDNGPLGLTLTGDGLPHTSDTSVNTAQTSYSGYSAIALSHARAVISAASELFVGPGDVAVLAGGYSDTAFGDDAFFVLDAAALTVIGNSAAVEFGASDQQNSVSFWGPAGGAYVETVTGSGGAVTLSSVHVDLTGDNDIIYFNLSDDTLDLTAATPGAWSTLYASSGTVNLRGASLNVIGGGVTINGVSGDNAVSLYQTDGVADAVHGDGVIVTLVNAQASVEGGGDTIWFVDGSASTVTLNLQAGQFATVYGAGTIDLGGGAVVSVGGGALVDFTLAGATAHLSYTEGVWDRVQGAAGTIVLDYAQAVVYGGNQFIEFGAGDDVAVSLYQTNGDWDSVVAPEVGYSGSNPGSLYVNGAQVNLYGGGLKNIRLSGAGAAISLYGQQYSYDQNFITGSNATVIVNAPEYVQVTGGGDMIFVPPTAIYANLTLTNSGGLWDNVYEQDQSLSLDDAQASVFGGGNAIYAGGGDAVSLYNTGADMDTVNDGGAVTLTDASAHLSGSNFYLYFDPGVNTADLSFYHQDDLLTFVGAFGQDAITGFGASDSLALSKAQFADFQAFQNAFTQQGDDAVLTLDADDKVTFVGLQTSAVAAAQVKFL